LGKSLVRDSIPYPNIFFPIVGVLGLIVAYVNIQYGDNDTIVVAAQCYVVAYHTGAVFTHIRIGDHPASRIAASLFVLIGMVLLVLRLGILIGLVVTAVFIGVGVGLGHLIVIKPPTGDEPLLDDDNEAQ